jgi:competence protein CoiA
MLSARRQKDGQTVSAYFESKANAPFFCLVCNDKVLLKTGRNRINHFAHANPLACRFAEAESETHRRCKMEIYEALLCEPNVSNVRLEQPMGSVRPDVMAEIGGVPVAIEVQLSSLSVATITSRTIEYHRKGICVLWLLQWTPKLDAVRYSPKNWEKWLHACYFGRVYYWTCGLNVVSYHFDVALKSVPRKVWFDKNGKRMTGGGFTIRSKRNRRAERGRTFNLATDFGPRLRFWWEGNGIKLPDAKLFMQRN